jgi:transketolase
MGWDYFISHKQAFIGMESFGASAPAEVLYEKFGLTVDAVINKVMAYQACL